MRQNRMPVFIALATCFWVHTSLALDFTRCQINVEARSMDAECATLTRPEDPSKPNGKSIDLFVAKLAAKTVEPASDAFTVIQGGPGGSSIDMAVGLGQVLDMIRSKRDVIVIDQRGTGRSNKLACDIDDKPGDFNLEKVAKLTKACTRKLAKNDLSAYTTSVAVQDLEALRVAAGYEQLSVYGVSYGTRVAQHYLRRFPKQTRTLIIDGVADIGLNLAGAEIARRSQEAFNNIVKRCTATQSCASEFGDIKEKFSQLRARLIAEPQKLSFAHPRTGKKHDYTLTQYDLLGAVRLMPYSTEGLALLPMLIAQAHAGNYIPLAASIVSTNEMFGDAFATGMHNSVVCTEDAPFVKPGARAAAKDTYFGSLMIDAMSTTCAHWPKGLIDDDFLEPFNSDTPVLILSGETDPITPPTNGHRAAEMFSNSKHLVVPSHGHGVIGRGCVPFLVRDFLVNADFDELNTKCIERERAMPFFIDASGPKP